jgi:hypothetical protein
VNRNVRDLIDRIVAKFMHWDGHDTEQRDDTDAVGKRKVHLTYPYETAAGKDTPGQSESSGEGQIQINAESGCAVKGGGPQRG